MSVLFFHTMKYRPEDPRNASNDRFVLSKVALSENKSRFICLLASLRSQISPSPIWPLTLISGPCQGHAAPVLYAVWAETGYLKENELLNLRKVDSILEGHPVPVRSQWENDSLATSETTPA